MNIHIYRILLDKEKTMFNITILKMKDIKKYIIGIAIALVIVLVGGKILSTKNREKHTMPKIPYESSLTSCLDKTIPVIGYLNEEEQEESKKIQRQDIFQGILKTQVSSIARD